MFDSCAHCIFIKCNLIRYNLFGDYDEIFYDEVDYDFVSAFTQLCAFAYVRMRQLAKWHTASKTTNRTDLVPGFEQDHPLFGTHR